VSAPDRRAEARRCSCGAPLYPQPDGTEFCALCCKPPAPSAAPSDAEVAAIVSDVIARIQYTAHQIEGGELSGDYERCIRQIEALRSLIAARSRRSALEALGEKALESINAYIRDGLTWKTTTSATHCAIDIKDSASALGLLSGEQNQPKDAEGSASAAGPEGRRDAGASRKEGTK